MRYQLRYIRTHVTVWTLTLPTDQTNTKRTAPFPSNSPLLPVASIVLTASSPPHAARVTCPVCAASSAPVAPPKFGQDRQRVSREGHHGRLAQLVARFLHTEEVIGSSPVSPTAANPWQRHGFSCFGLQSRCSQPSESLRNRPEVQREPGFPVSGLPPEAAPAIGSTATRCLSTEVAEVRQLPSALAKRLRRSVVEHVERGAIGEVAEVVQVAGGDLDGAVPEPRLHGRQRHALDVPFTGCGVPEVVEGTSAAGPGGCGGVPPAVQRQRPRASTARRRTRCGGAGAACRPARREWNRGPRPSRESGQTPICA